MSRVAVDPAAFAWLLHPGGVAARARLLRSEAFTPAYAIVAVRVMRPRVEEATGLARGELWDLLEGLLRHVKAVPQDDYGEFLPLAERMVPRPCAPALAVALALDVDELLAGDASFAGQRLVPVRRADQVDRQGTLRF